MTDDDHPANARRVQLRTAISTSTQSGLGRATSADRGTQTRLRSRLNPRQLRRYYGSFKSEPLCGCSRWRTIQPPLQYTEKPDQSNPRIPVQLLPARRGTPGGSGNAQQTTGSGSGILHSTSKGHNNPVPDSIPAPGFQLINTCIAIRTHYTLLTCTRVYIAILLSILMAIRPGNPRYEFTSVHVLVRVHVLIILLSTKEHK